MSSSSVEPSVVRVFRGGIEESLHRVRVAVSDADGTLRAWSGDPDAPTFYRSAAKPFQALPLVEDGVVERFGLTSRELSLCCGSHEGEPEHLDGVRSILGKAGLDTDALRCGPHAPFSETEAHRLVRAGEAPGPLHNNCSGKHAGMLALAVAHGWDTEGYHRAGHPVQERMADEITRWSRIPREQVGTGVDGCGVPCFAVPVRAMAGSFARFARAAAEGEPAGQVVAAMVEHPFMAAGTGRACTDVMERAEGACFVKLGAEGVYGGGVPGAGRGFALKVADGGRRAVEAVLVHLLAELDVLDDADLDALARFAGGPLRNTRDEVVGEVRCELRLTESGVET